MSQEPKMNGHASSAPGNRVRANLVGNCLTIHVEGRFEFGCHQAFRCAYEGAAGKFTDCVVDLKATDYVDSAALGMLLVLRETVGVGKVSIANCQPGVQRIFRIANFASLFAIG